MTTKKQEDAKHNFLAHKRVKLLCTSLRVRDVSFSLSLCLIIIQKSIKMSEESKQASKQSIKINLQTYQNSQTQVKLARFEFVI